MRNFTALLVLTAVGLGGCAYKSAYSRTNFDIQPKRVAPAEVKVVKSADDLVSKYTELGRYRGRAPTVQQAMDTAKDWCGEAGADLYILTADPAQGGSGWNVEGHCALMDPSTTPKSMKKKKRRKKGKKGKQAKKAA